MKRFMRFLTLSGILAWPLLVSGSAAAAATMSMSAPASATQGSIFTVSIYEDSGSTAVNAASIHLTYSASQLDFVGTGSSPTFGITAADNGGGGSVTVDRGALPEVTGRQLVATVRFSAKVGSGSAVINFANDSHVLATDQTELFSGGSAAAVTLQAAPAGGSGGSGGGQSGGSSGGGSSLDLLAPSISNVRVAAVGTNTVTITWTTSEPATSEVDYGLNTRYGFTAVDNNLVTQHSVVVSSPAVRAATAYHFTVKSSDAAGNTSAGTDSTFTTKGVSLLVKVVNGDAQPLEGALVAIGEASGTTDPNGQTTLHDVTAGTQEASVTYNGKTTTTTVTVGAPDENGESPALTLTAGGAGLSVLLLIIFGVLIVIAAGAAWFVRNRKKLPKYF